MKKFLSVLFCFVVAFLLSFQAFAKAELSKYIYDEKEYDIAYRSVSEDLMLKENNISTSIVRAYKTHRVSSTDLLKLKDNFDLSEILAFDLQWKFVNTDGILINVKNVSDKWEVTSYTSPSPETTDTIDIPVDEMDKILSENDISNEAAQNMLAIESPEYHTVFLLFKEKQYAYLIPYGSRPDLTKLVNGIKYKLSDAKEILVESFGEPSANAGSFGGGNAIKEKDNSYSWKVVFIPLLIVVGLLILFMLRKIFQALKKKQNAE